MHCIDKELKCINCGQLYSSDIKNKMNLIKKTNKSIMISIIMQEALKEVKRQETRKSLQKNIQNTITLKKLYKAFNSKESKEYNKKVHQQRLAKRKQMKKVNNTINL